MNKEKIAQPASYWIDHLNLQPHPEGGFYHETYRSTENINIPPLPLQVNGQRNISTAIYFLLRSSDRSLFHRIRSDELWHFHAGNSLILYVLGKQGISSYKLGTNLEEGDRPQVVIPANHWFGACVTPGGDYTLASCTVAPGFDFQDFEMATRSVLLTEFPAYKEIILDLTRAWKTRQR